VLYNNNHSGRNKGKEKRNWALVTNLTGVDNSISLCNGEHSNATWDPFGTVIGY